MELRGTYTTGGGPDKTILLSAERHDRSIVNPIVVYLRDISDNNFQIGRMAEGRGFQYIEVLDRSKIDIKCIIELNGIVKKCNIDIIHGHDVKTDILAFILGTLNPKVHLLSTAHGWITNNLKGTIYKWFHLRALRKFSHLIAVSEATKALMVSSGITSGKIKVIYNGIDEKHWNNNGQCMTLKNEWGIPDKAFVVGTVGRISEEKDYNTFLRIAKIVTGEMPDTYFVIVGDGKRDEKDELVSYADKLGIKDRMIFTGFRSDLINVYCSFDIFLMTSLTEGIPNTMLEAMSMGIPVVSTSVGGIPEMVVNGESAFLFNTGDMNGLANKIMELITSKELRDNISSAGRKRIEELFSFSRRLKIIEEYYVNIINGVSINPSLKEGDKGGF